MAGAGTCGDGTSSTFSAARSRGRLPAHARAVNQAPTRCGSEWRYERRLCARSALLSAGMRELGYVDGQNIDIEYRFADGRLELTCLTLQRSWSDFRQNVIMAARYSGRCRDKSADPDHPDCLPLACRSDRTWLDCERVTARRQRDRRFVPHRRSGWQASRACAPNRYLGVVKIGFCGECRQRDNYRPARIGERVSEVETSSWSRPRSVHPMTLMRHFRHWQMTMSEAVIVLVDGFVFQRRKTDRRACCCGAIASYLWIPGSCRCGRPCQLRGQPV